MESGFALRPRVAAESVATWVVVAVVAWRAIGLLHQDVRAAQGGIEFWGVDFHGGAWLAAHQILQGTSPYLAANPQLLLHFNHAFVTPPAIGLATVPLAHLPYGLAITIWNLADVAGMLAALWLLNVRDLRLYAIVIFAAPFIDSLNSGQIEGVLALLLALSWRGRTSWRGAVAAGALIAVKLYAFPLVIWLIATKRFRSAAIASGSAALFLLGSWALIDFHGLAQYPSLLNATAHAAEKEFSSLSMVTLLGHLGSNPLGTALPVACGLLVMALIVLSARGSDDGWFAACITVGLIASPILWEHYLLLLFVPLAISRPRTIWPWLLTGLLWVQYSLGSAAGRAAVTLVLAALLPLVATMRDRKTTGQPLEPAPTRSPVAA